ncbi:MAG: hypothetical protein R2816_06745 [Flavobacteriaceae bacterium]|nr:hypothetical protein [Flavobacteriaceae bacterium]
MNNTLTYKLDTQRRLFIKKDLEELNLWISSLENFNVELDHFSAIEKQLIRDHSTLSLIQGLRRRNVLCMAMLCKYNQELTTEYDYGKTEYNLSRAKIHDKKREQFLEHLKEFNSFKNNFYKLLMKYKLK